VATTDLTQWLIARGQIDHWGLVMKSLSRSLTFALLLGSVSMPASAGNFFEEVGKIATAPIRAPIQMGQDVIKGRPPGEIINNQMTFKFDSPLRPEGKF